MADTGAEVQGPPDLRSPQEGLSMEQRSASRCAVVAGLLPAAAVGALDPVEQVGVTEHLLHCTACRATFVEYESLLLQLAYAVPLVEPPAHLRIRLMRAIGASGCPADRAAGQSRG